MQVTNRVVGLFVTAAVVTLAAGATTGTQPAFARPRAERCGFQPPSAAESFRIERALARTRANRVGALHTGATYTIPVVFHVITSSDGSLGNLANADVQNQIAVLNDAFAGAQSGPAVDTPFRFGDVLGVV
ncbi:MAG: hypothetical protein FJX77_15835, partial [Armatimonadetes bacterium]|nr:hypothetical protein [Armatimonadota bacterium]